MASRRLTAVPATRSSAKALRVKQNIIIGAVVGAALLGPLAFINNARSQPAAPAVASVASGTIAYAEAIARDFLNGNATTLPVASGVDTTFGAGTQTPDAGLGFEWLTYVQTTSSTIGLIPVDVVKFAAGTEQGEFGISIPVTYSTEGDPLLAAAPALSPHGLPAGDAVPEPMPTAEAGFTEDVPSLVQDRIARWAAAYAEDDGDALRLLVNGEDAPIGSNYVGLGGFTCEGSCVTHKWASESPSFPGFAIVRAEVLFRSTSAEGLTLRTSYDLLVRGWRSDAPRVQAWGPAGTGELLAPYINSSVR